LYEIMTKYHSYDLNDSKSMSVQNLIVISSLIDNTQNIILKFNGRLQY